MSTTDKQPPETSRSNAVTCCDVRQWVDAEAIAVIEDLIPSCPGEIRTIAAALFNLSITTKDHAGDVEADGFIFRAEEARQRADNYRETLDEICRIWGDDPGAPKAIGAGFQDD